jgi:hypothetical protein
MNSQQLSFLKGKCHSLGTIAVYFEYHDTQGMYYGLAYVIHDRIPDRNTGLL